MDNKAYVTIFEYRNERFKLFKLIADMIWCMIGLLAILMLVATLCGSHVMTEFISILIGG